MAEPLGRFDSSGVHASAGGNGAVAVAARDGSAHIYQKEGLLVSVWGRARFLEPRLAELAHAGGIAKTLADNWRERGEQIFASLTGSFCCCILNENANEAALATDRMGTYPLSYQISAGGLVFGSSADAINLHPLIKPKIAPQSLYNYVYFHMVPGPDTIYQGQKRLLPGE